MVRRASLSQDATLSVLKHKKIVASIAASIVPHQCTFYQSTSAIRSIYPGTDRYQSKQIHSEHVKAPSAFQG